MSASIQQLSGERLNRCPPPHPRFVKKPSQSQASSSSSSSAPHVESREETIPQITLNPQFETLPDPFRDKILDLISSQNKAPIIYRTFKDGVNGDWKAVKIKHSRTLQRSLLVTSSGRVFMLFTRCRRGGDLRIGVGGLKKHSVAVCLSSFGFYDVVSATKTTIVGLSNLKEFKISSKVSDSVVTGSFVVGARKDYWIEKLEDGDLISAQDECPEYFQSLMYRTDLSWQMAQKLTELHDLGYYHLDVKPDNYLYNETDAGRLVLRLTDYGLCRKKSEEVRDVCGSFFYISPEAFREDHEFYLRVRQGPYEYPSEEHEGWQLGVSYLGLFYKYLNQEFLRKNSMVRSYVSFAALEPDHLLFKMRSLWGNPRTRPAQSNWIREPSPTHRLEYVIYHLLQIDPKLRWTPRRASEYLEQCVKNDAKEIEKIELHIERLKTQAASKRARGSKRASLKTQIDEFTTHLIELQKKLHGSSL